MKFTVIDFETANNKRSSACAIGLSVIENGKIIKEMSYLIKPHDMLFLPMNIGIHGIRPTDVVDAPSFEELYYAVLKPYLENQLVVAHNASFDISVLRACLTHYNIEFPELDYLCTVKLAQKCWPDLQRHSLDVVSRYLQFDFKHHDAFDDARACANIVIQAMNEKNKALLPLLKDFNIKLGKLFKNGYTPCSSRKS